MVRFKLQKSLAAQLPSVAITPDDISLLLSAREYRAKLLELIAGAQQRIYITALYVQDDEAGREVIDALVAAKQRQPALDICVFVDAHRARRGLIGAKESLGNAALYRQIDEQYPDLITFYGIAVKRKELFGVLHLKGMIFDDHLLYTGASINDVYLHQDKQYRYDRYAVLRNGWLTNAIVKFLQNNFVDSSALVRFDRHFNGLPADFNKQVLQQQKRLNKAHYQLAANAASGHDKSLTVTPLVGLGKRNNQLNRVIHQQITKTRQHLLMYTPYFNLPPVLKRDLKKLLRRGVTVELVVGDKTANDFFIPPEERFSKIGLIPYVYETMLRQFVRQHQKYIDSDQLKVALWCDPGHSFHLKGLCSDDRYHLLTGNNFNPRAWRLDIENGLLIDDKEQQLKGIFEQEHQQIMSHTRQIKHWQEVESLENYPLEVRKWLKRLHRTQLDRLFKRWM